MTAIEGTEVTNEPAPRGTLATAAVDRILGPQREEYLHDAQLLIAACRDLITETGSVAPPVSLILKRAGLGSRAFYRLFPSKRDLLMAVLEAGTEALQARIRSRLDTIPDPATRIHTWIDTFIEHTTSTPADGTASLILDAPRLSAIFPDASETLERRIIAPLHEALGDLRRDADTDANLADATVVYDMVASAVVRALSRRQPIAKPVRAHLHACTTRVIEGPDRGTAAA